MSAQPSDKLSASRFSVVGSVTIGDVIDLANVNWSFIKDHVRYTTQETSLQNGNVLECILQGVTIFRFITTLTDENGYPVEDSFYGFFNGVTLSDLITTR